MSTASKAMPEPTPEAQPEPIRAFDPSGRLIKISGRGGQRDYLPAQARLDWLRSEAPDSVVEQQHIEITDTYAIFKTTVTRIVKGEIKGRADGYGHEWANDFPDFVLKAATVSLARALNALGYGGNDLDEGLAEGNVADAGSEPRGDRPADIREKEMKRLHAIAANKFPAEGDTPAKHKALHDLHVLASGQAGLGDATVQDIRKLINWLDPQSADDSQLKLEWAREMAKDATLAGLAKLREEMASVAKAAGQQPDPLMVVILGRRVEEIKKHLAADKALARTDAAVHRTMTP